MDFTSLTGQLLSAGITRTLPPAPVSVDGPDREPLLLFPVEGEVEVARKNLPSRAVIQFDDVALGMGPDPHGAFIPRRRAMRRPIGYFRPDGACAFELLGSGLLASWWPTAQPAAAPSLPWPAMWPATPPTMAPSMHPLASAGEKEASASRQTEVKMTFMVVLRDHSGPTGQVLGGEPVPPVAILLNWLRRHGVRSDLVGTMMR